jgi:hypothetical protein
VLVLQAHQLRDQDQVAVAIPALPIGAAKARRDCPVFTLEDQERSRVRAGPGIARLAGPLLRNLRREPLGAGALECGNHLLLEL